MTMPTPLIPQEIYLLERYISLERYGLVRDAWEAVVKYCEECLDKFMRQLPPDYRSRQLPEQPDIVWGERVIPNFRDTLQFLIDGYIKRSHQDWSCYLGFQGGVNGDIRGQRDFSPAWFDEVEPGGTNKYYDLLYLAGQLASSIGFTSGASWAQGDLTERYEPDARGPLNPPDKWPKYRINPEVTVSTGETVPRTGIYLPLIDDSCAAFMGKGAKAPPATVGYNPETMQNISEDPCEWVLIERVPGEYVEDGLADLLQGDAGSLHVERVSAGNCCPQSGWWYTPAKANSRRYFKQSEVFPKIEGSDYGETFWLWSPDQTSPSS